MFPNVYKHRHSFNCIIANKMDSSGNYIPYSRNFQRWELQTRRLRLISDVMEDYQENMRRAFRLIGCELGISNHVFPNMRTAANLNVDDWLDRVSQATYDMYSPGGQTTESEYERREEPPYSFNRSPPLPRPNIRRGFVYTQLLEPRDDPAADRGITNEQIASSTQLIQYDFSMNEARCPISLDYFELGQNILQINNCRHIFGHQPLMEWFQRHSRCPVCRASVLSTNSQQPQTQTNNTPSVFDRILERPLNNSNTNTGSVNMRANAQVNINAGNVLSTSSAISQILSGILTGVNGAVNTETGYYESEFAFNVNDLLDAYTELIGSQPSTTTPSTQPSEEEPR